MLDINFLDDYKITREPLDKITFFYYVKKLKSLLNIKPKNYLFKAKKFFFELVTQLLCTKLSYKFYFY